MDLLTYLRTHTSDCHRRTERRLPFFSPDFTLDQYKSVLAAFYGYLAPLEHQCARWASVSPVNLTVRSKVPALLSDLHVLRVDTNYVQTCHHLPDVSTLSRFVGSLYVIEGSTLGGQLISRHLEERFGLGLHNGAAYFRGYGSETGERWKEFRRSVADREAEFDREEALAGATQTFTTLEAWLAEIL